MGGVYVYHRKERRANRGEIGPDIRTTGEGAILGKTSITTPLPVGMLPMLQPRKYHLLSLGCVSRVHHETHVEAMCWLLAFLRDARIKIAYFSGREQFVCFHLTASNTLCFIPPCHPSHYRCVLLSGLFRFA